MILKRQEKDGKIKAMYESSNILASTYDTATNDLTIIFKAGTQYKYSKVSRTDYMRFEIAESQGAVFNTHIKKYPTTKLEFVDPARILNEAANLLAEEQKALIEGKKKKIFEQIGVVTATANDEIMFPTNLLVLKGMIEDFFKKDKTD